MDHKQNTEVRRKNNLTRLFEIAGSKRWWLIGSMTLSVLATAAQFAPFVVVYLVIAEFARNGAAPTGIDRDYVFLLGYLCMGSVVVYGVLFFCANMLSHIAAFNILYEIRVKLTEKLSKLSMGYFTKRATGTLKKILSEDVERIELFVAHHIPDLTSAIVFPLLVFGYLFYLDWLLALIAIIPLPAALLVQALMFLSPSARETYRQYHTSLENLNSTVIEYVRGMPIVKIFNQSSDAFDGLKRDVANHQRLARGFTEDYALVYPGYLTVLSSSLLFIIPAAVYLLLRAPSYDEYLPTVLLFMILGGGVFFPLFKLMWMSGFLTNITVGLDRVDDILEHPELDEPENGLLPKDASVEFRNVGFTYDTAQVIHNVSFTAAPDTVTALVGPSGAGKTTIGLLCARFWDIQEGDILIGGVSVRDMPTEILMDHVSFVFQDGFMFFDTIEENIRMGCSDATKEDVIRAARAAQCHEFIEKLPDGYDTLIGEGGIYLSGGEQQRIGLARAILKDSPIVVLDEATAYADPENEGRMLASFAQLIQGKTVIIVAHRLSTITQADSILVIDKGEIVEQGTHEQLVLRDGLYTNMWNMYTASREWVINTKGGRLS